MRVDTTGLAPAAVLAALYNASRPLGLGILQWVQKDMTMTEAASLLVTGTSFDYLQGRVLKVDLDDHDEFEAWLYDRDNGDGAAQRVIDALRATVRGGEAPSTEDQG